jgi:uncharacterized spore protein YtfJ
MSDVNEIQDQLRQQTDEPAFLEHLVERVGGAARAEAVFAPPVERGGVTVIPVARARWGFGGGGGESPEGQGSGGGGGGMVAPLGYIEIRDDRTEFRRIGDARLLVLAAGAAVALAAAILRSR